MMSILMGNSDFFSIDRLVEFGLSTAIASKMVQSMNIAIDNMSIPGCTIPSTNPQSLYYAIINEMQVGPCSESELCKLINEGKINKDSFIWRPGMSSWQMAKNVPEILRLVALTPPPFKNK